VKFFRESIELKKLIALKAYSFNYRVRQVQMKKLLTIARESKLNVVLCCSAAVLLTVCGGASAGTGDAPTVLAASSVAVPSASEQVNALYQKLLDRDADPVSLQNWTTAVNSGMSIDTVEAEIKAGAEYVNRPATTAAATSISPAAVTATYHLYVSTTGSDSNPGSQSRPFRTIQKAANVAKAGTAVHVAAGTYSGNISTKVHGTSTARVTYVSDTKWGAKVVGSGTGAMWTNSANYTDIVGFNISGPGRLGISNNGSNTRMMGNYIHDIKVSGGCTGAGGAGIVNGNYSAVNGDVIGNVVARIGTPGKCNGVQGIYSSIKGGKIQNNIVYGVSAYGIHLWHAATDIVIANNTVFANGAGSIGGGIVTGNGDSPGGTVMRNVKIVNNIVYKNRTAISQYCSSGKSCIGTGNIVANNLTYGNTSNGISLRVGSATGTVTADPQFVNYQANGTGNYRLKSSTSPAANRGTASYAPATDIDNVARPRGGKFDIGAYESF
jgi:hypothetical protein